ncbi:MAG: 3-oxoacyl-ACP reductase family protein [Verrucomicrobiota bacterium]
MRLKNKTILVTGASKGIGKALALGMAREGADLIVNYNSDGQGALGVVEEIRAMGRLAMAVQADIGRVGQIQKMFEFARREHNRLDVLVNNAGITDWTSLFEVTEEKWDWVIDTNLKGTFFCSLEAAKWMRETGGGAVVNVSTNCAALGVKNLVAYATSKAGIHGLTKQLAVELAPYKIRVNTFAPGPTQVDRNLRDDPDYDRNWGSMVPMNRTALPEEMVGPAVFLASEESSYMTGQVFYVDGGWTAQGKIPIDNMDQAMAKNR